MFLLSLFLCCALIIHIFVHLCVCQFTYSYLFALSYAWYMLYVRKYVFIRFAIRYELNLGHPSTEKREHVYWFFHSDWLNKQVKDEILIWLFNVLPFAVVLIYLHVRTCSLQTVMGVWVEFLTCIALAFSPTTSHHWN